jgi:hypothetical protein
MKVAKYEDLFSESNAKVLTGRLIKTISKPAGGLVARKADQGNKNF